MKPSRWWLLISIVSLTLNGAGLTGCFWWVSLLGVILGARGLYGYCEELRGEDEAEPDVPQRTKSI